MDSNAVRLKKQGEIVNQSFQKDDEVEIVIPHIGNHSGKHGVVLHVQKNEKAYVRLKGRKSPILFPASSLRLVKRSQKYGGENEVSRIAGVRPGMEEAAKAMDEWIEEMQSETIVPPSPPELAHGMSRTIALARIKAHCRNCKAVTEHRHHNSELVCNTCHWIAVTFHEPVAISNAKSLEEVVLCPSCEGSGGNANDEACGACNGTGNATPWVPKLSEYCHLEVSVADINDDGTVWLFITDTVRTLHNVPLSSLRQVEGGAK